MCGARSSTTCAIARASPHASAKSLRTCTRKKKRRWSNLHRYGRPRRPRGCLRSGNRIDLPLRGSALARCATECHRTAWSVSCSFSLASGTDFPEDFLNRRIRRHPESMRASLYEALGIAPTASDEEVRAALRRLIRKYYAKTRDGQGNVEEALRFIN